MQKIKYNSINKSYKILYNNKLEILKPILSKLYTLNQLNLKSLSKIKNKYYKSYFINL